MRGKYYEAPYYVILSSLVAFRLSCLKYSFGFSPPKLYLSWSEHNLLFRTFVSVAYSTFLWSDGLYLIQNCSGLERPTVQYSLISSWEELELRNREMVKFCVATVTLWMEFRLLGKFIIIIIIIIIIISN